MVAVAERGRDVEFDFAALGHLLDALGPAGDHLVELELGGLVALDGAVEDFAVEQRAGVVDLHGVRGLRCRAFALLHDFVVQAAGQRDDGLVLAELREVGGVGGLVLRLQLRQIGVLALLHELVHGRPNLLELEGRILAKRGGAEALEENLDLLGGELQLGEADALANEPAELLEELRVGERGRRRGLAGQRDLRGRLGLHRGGAEREQ